MLRFYISEVGIIKTCEGLEKVEAEAGTLSFTAWLMALDTTALMYVNRNLTRYNNLALSTLWIFVKWLTGFGFRV